MNRCSGTYRSLVSNGKSPVFCTTFAVDKVPEGNPIAGYRVARSLRIANKFSDLGNNRWTYVGSDWCISISLLKI